VNMIQRTCNVVLLTLVVASVAVDASAQYFGRNKVTWEQFDFEVIHTEHFDIYHYPESAASVHDFGRMAERWYARHSDLLDHEFAERKPIVLYADDTDFQQTNVISGTIGQGTGGVTESFKNRIVMPLTASYAETDHVLGHELVHVFQYDMIERATGRLQGLRNIPLWFVEGMSEYLSIGPVDAHTALWLRDAVLRDELPDLDDLARDPRYFPYRFGHAVWSYVASRGGDDAVRAFFVTSLRDGVEVGIESVLGVDPETFVENWHRSLREVYGDTGARRSLEPQNAREVVARIPDEQEINVGPEPSPDGRMVAFFSERDLFSIELFLADAETGEIVRSLTEVTSNPHLRALRFIDSAGAWSPDGDRFAFVVYHEGRNELSIVDGESGEEQRRLRIEGVDAIASPDWSPDGRRVVVSGLSGGASDLYVIEVESGAVQQLTDDRYAALQPTWAPGGDRVAFVTDRGGETDMVDLVFDETGIGLLWVDDPSRVEVHRPLGPDADHTDPALTDDGRLLVRGIRHGFQDLYLVDFDTGVVERKTHLATGVHAISPMSPSMGLARGSGTIFYDVFEAGGYSIWAQDLGVTVSSDGEASDVAVIPDWQRTDEGPVERGLRDTTRGLPPADRAFGHSDYRPSLSLDWIGSSGAGVAVDRFGTRLSGGVAARFSDMLGRHQLSMAAQIDGGIADTGAQVTYTDVGRRWNWGASVSHIPYRTYVYRQRTDTVDGPEGGEQTVGVLERERLRTTVERAEGFLSYPFSRTRRVELGGGVAYYHFDSRIEQLVLDQQGRVLGQRSFDADDPAGLTLVQPSVALVEDTSFFGFTSPVMGTRLRLEYGPTFGSVRFHTVLADARHYEQPFEPSTVAVRLMHYGRYGDDAEDDRFSSLYLGYPTLVRGYDAGDFGSEDCPDGECPEFDRLVGSRIGVVNVEWRLQLFGSDRYGVIDGGPLPTEISLFFDGGVAWTKSDTPVIAWETDTRDRVPVFSAGVAARVALFGALPLEFHLAHPFQRDDVGLDFGFVIAPGW